MRANLRFDIDDIFRYALAAVVPSATIPENLALLDDDRLRIGRQIATIPDSGIFIVSIGKASIPMAVEASKILGERITESIIVSKDDWPTQPDRARILLGSHPVPDQRSLVAGDAVLKFADSIPEDAVVLCLISGGGSALVEAPATGIELQVLQETTESLLKAGATIHEMNAVRARMSALKAGGLLWRLRHTRVFNLIVSDVLGDDPSVIAGGPTFPQITPVEAEAVLEKFDVEIRLPELKTLAQSEPPTVIIATVSRAIDAVGHRARQLGYRPFVLTRTIDGEARDVAGVLSSIAIDAQSGRSSLRPGVCMIAGGETTVTVHGPGVGGRNTECALAAALRLEGVSRVAAGFLATDGDDATTGAAGAIVTGSTIRPENRLEAHWALDENDSYTFLLRENCIIKTGPTGTNVNDLAIILLGE